MLKKRHVVWYNRKKMIQPKPELPYANLAAPCPENDLHSGKEEDEGGPGGGAEKSDQPGVVGAEAVLGGVGRERNRRARGLQFDAVAARYSI